MRKSILLIGFFIAWATGSSASSHTGSRFCGIKIDYGSATLPFDYTAITPGDVTHPSAVTVVQVERPETPPTTSPFWLIALALLLLTLPLYLLFLIRKKQTLANKVVALQRDITLLFDHAPCGYHSLDQDGTLVNINDTLLRWLKYEKSEVVNKLRFQDMVAGEQRDVREKVTALITGRISGSVQLTLIKKTGEHLPVLLREIFLPGADGDARKRLFGTIDYQDCHQALERIRTLDQELESFSYSISHDLRAPLRSIDGYSKILQEDYASQLGDEGRRVLNVIMNNAKRMGTLIDDLLEFGRLGRKALQRSQIDMTALVKSVVDELLLREEARTIDVVVEPLETTFADAEMIRQVWYNLLDNAFKYTAKNDVTRIAIRSYKTDKSEACYEVKDNGVGFDMKYAPKLFGVFQRLHKTQDFAGTGVGLAIVKRIVSRHGGRVWADASLDSGAIFYFTIPIEDENT